ncbi:MAG: tRNA pseudouridine(55) synthase TruB [Steroidobacteraceae bacterium]
MSAGPRRGAWRRVDGIVLLDKPAGATSTGALQRVRRLLQAAKAGHAGTLDPMATGMLPLCFGQATKASGMLLGSAKAYRARLKLGAATDTGDAEGTVVSEAPVPPLTREQMLAVLEGLRGPGMQVPPMYSALKRQGRPLYELARRGEVVPREPRAIEIRRLDLVALAPDSLEFEVVCSKGTYIRVLGEEVATRVGSVGHLTALRRLWVEPFEADAMVSLEEIEQWAASESRADPPGWLLPADTAFRRLPRIDLSAGQALHLRQGRVLEAPAGSVPAERLAAYAPAGEFLGVVSVGADLRVRTVRLFVAGDPDENTGTA